MKQIIKDLLDTAILASPADNDLVGELTIHQRHGGSISAGKVQRIKGGLHINDADDPFQLHLIDEDNIAAITVVLNEEKASEAGVHDLAQLNTWALRQERWKA